MRYCHVICCPTRFSAVVCTVRIGIRMGLIFVRYILYSLSLETIRICRNCTTDSRKFPGANAIRMNWSRTVPNIL